MDAYMNPKSIILFRVTQSTPPITCFFGFFSVLKGVKGIQQQHLLSVSVVPHHHRIFITLEDNTAHQQQQTLIAGRHVNGRGQVQMKEWSPLVLKLITRLFKEPLFQLYFCLWFASLTISSIAWPPLRVSFLSVHFYCRQRHRWKLYSRHVLQWRPNYTFVPPDVPYLCSTAELGNPKRKCFNFHRCYYPWKFIKESLIEQWRRYCLLPRPSRASSAVGSVNAHEMSLAPYLATLHCCWGFSMVGDLIAFSQAVTN